MKKIVTQVSVMLFLLYSCNSKQSKQPEETSRSIEKITVAITDGTFDAPVLIPSGYVDIKLLNNTNEIHSAHLIKLDAGYTSQQLIKTYSDSIKTGGERPNWMTHIGGIISEPGSSARLNLEFEPGVYVIYCMANAEGKFHLLDGAIHSFKIA